MIRAVANWIMYGRARKLADRLLPFLPEDGLIADVGSGTGHNSVILRKRSACDIQQFDVADMHWVGERPHRISDESATPLFAGREVDCVLLIFVLQYPQDPTLLLNRILNEGPKQILVLQSTYRNRWGKCVFRIQEAVFGPLAFYVARFAGLIPNEKCSVKPVRFFRSDRVVDLLNLWGLQVCHQQSNSHWLLGTGSDLLVCRKAIL